MADGGASSMIMLITALLISGGASALLLSQWSDALGVVQSQDRAAIAKGDVDVALAGDPAMVSYNTTTKTITLFFVNSGNIALETTDYEVLINGAAPTSTTETVLPSGTDWEPGRLLEVELTNTNWTFADGDDVRVFFVGVSESVSGASYSATTSGEVRLHVV